jgi:hypothetical protein
MTTDDLLYQELKREIEHIASPLFGASETFIKKRGAFLPHGAVRTTGGEVRLVMAAPDNFEKGLVSTIEVLPLLHDALRQSATMESLSAVAVGEDVRLTLEGQPETRAIKVLVEHRRGLCVALHLPFRRRLFGFSFGEMFVKSASPEVNAWTLPNAIWR